MQGIAKAVVIAVIALTFASPPLEAGTVTTRWVWYLQSGRNTLRARSVNMLGAKGKPSTIVINHADSYLGSFMDGE